MYELALLIEGTADAMNVSVEKLTPQTDSPFSLSDCPRLDAAYTFDILLGTTGVIDHWIARTFGSYSAFWSPPNPAITNLIDQEQALFIHDEDQCWCTLGFWIRKAGAKYQLVEKEDAKCCPTVPIPTDVGAQNAWIDSVAANARKKLKKRYQGNYYDEDIKRCARDPSGERFRMALNGSDDEGTVTYSLQYAHRAIKGKIVWLISPAYYEQLWNLITQIIEGSCGARPDMIQKAETKSYLCEFSVVRPVDILWTLQETGLLVNEPGCLREQGCEVQKPWEEAACGAEFCDGQLQLYCRTLLDLELVATSLPTLLYPKNTPAKCGGLLSCNNGPSSANGSCQSATIFDRTFYAANAIEPDIDIVVDGTTGAGPEFTLSYPNTNDTGIGDPTYCPFIYCNTASGPIYETRLTWYYAFNSTIFRQLFGWYGLDNVIVPSMMPACKKKWWLQYQTYITQDNWFRRGENIFNLTHLIEHPEGFVRADTVAHVDDEYLTVDYSADDAPCSYLHMVPYGSWPEAELKDYVGQVGECGQINADISIRDVPGWSGVVKVENYILGTEERCISWLQAPGSFHLYQCCQCGDISSDPAGGSMDPYMTCDTETYPCPNGGEC